MATFKDRAKREWEVSLDGPKIKRVRDALKVDLADKKFAGLEQLADDIPLLVDVLWVLCGKQHSEVTDEQFGESMVGDPIEHAADALYLAVADFFPSRVGERLRKLHAAGQAVSAEAMKLVDENLPLLQSQVIAALSQQIQGDPSTTLTQQKSATESPEPVESNQTDAP